MCGVSTKKLKSNLLNVGAPFLIFTAKISLPVVSLAGLQITAGQRTMSGQK